MRHPALEYRGEALPEVHGEPAVNVMETGRPVPLFRKEKKVQEKSSGSCQVQEISMTPSRLKLLNDPYVAGNDRAPKSTAAPYTAS